MFCFPLQGWQPVDILIHALPGETLHSFSAGLAITLALSGSQLADIMEHVGWRLAPTASHYLKVARVLRPGGPSELLGVFHLQKISGNFGGNRNFHRVKNVFHLTQVRSPPSDCDFTRQNLKMWP